MPKCTRFDGRRLTPVCMKILYHHRTRGTDAQRVHIEEMVRAFRSAGHEVEMAALTGEQCHPAGDVARDAIVPFWKRLLQRIPFAWEAFQSGYNVAALPWLIWKIRTSRADILYERYSLFTFAGVMAARLCGVPAILEVNSPLALEQGRDRELRLLRIAGWFECVIASQASRVIVVSRPLARILTDLGVPSQRIEVMTNGANLSHLTAPRTEADPPLPSVAEGKTVIGFVGWFKRWHGLELLIESFAGSGLLRRKAVLLLAGDGPATAELKQLVQRLRLQDHVLFTGAVPHTEIPRYLRSMDIAVQPAANEYCCPMKILEYMAIRLPIVAPRQENICEILQHGANALLFTPGDRNSLCLALEHMVEDEALRHSLGEQAFDTITERGFTWERNAERVLAMVQEAAAVPSAAVRVPAGTECSPSPPDSAATRTY